MARHVFLVAKNEWKRGAEGRSRLRCRETEFAHGIAVSEAEDSFDLIIRDTFLDPDHILVKCRALPAEFKKRKSSGFIFGLSEIAELPNKLQIIENEGLVDIKAQCDNIFGIFNS